jgi:hypothetical protein
LAYHPKREDIIMTRPLAEDIVPLIQDRARSFAAAARWELTSPNPDDRWSDLDAQCAYVAVWESVTVWANTESSIVATTAGPAAHIHGQGIAGQVLDYGDDEYIWTNGMISTFGDRSAKLDWP